LPIVQKALAKNPAQRYGSMAEMARDVERAGGGAHHHPAELPQRPVAAAIPVLSPVNAKPAEPIPTVLPVVTFRGALHELCKSMIVAVLFAGVGAMIWAATGAKHAPQAKSLFFMSVLASWAVLIPSKLWTERRGDSWSRRIALLLVGAGVGATALWMEGWKPGASLDPSEGFEGMVRTTLFSASGLNEAAFISYYALAFFALRWWRMTDRRRPRRFSLFPVLASGFWAALLLLLVGTPFWHGIVLMMASAIVQLASPWEQPPQPAPKRVRLRCA
jgi:hypothetical protein